MKQDAVKMKPRSKNEARCSTFHTPPNACYYGRVQVGKKEEMVRCVTLTIKNYSRIPYCIPKKLFLLSNTLQQSAPETQLACRHANIINKRRKRTFINLSRRNGLPFHRWHTGYASPPVPAICPVPVPSTCTGF